MATILHQRHLTKNQKNPSVDCSTKGPFRWCCTQLSEQCLSCVSDWNQLLPKYLVHDNDSIFRSKVFQSLLKSSDIIAKRTAYRSPWQNPYAEGFIGTIKRELLDLVIPLNQKHLHKLLREYFKDYYNTDRTHQGINCGTPIPSVTYIPTAVEDTKLEATPVLNGLYYTYKKVA